MFYMRFVLRSLQTTALAAALAASPALIAQSSSDPTRGANPGTSTSDANTGQTTNPAATGNTGTGMGTYNGGADDRGGHNFGWIGLLGLAGLIGLGRRNHGPDVRTNRDDVRTG